MKTYQFTMLMAVLYFILASVTVHPLTSLLWTLTGVGFTAMSVIAIIKEKP